MDTNRKQTPEEAPPGVSGRLVPWIMFLIFFAVLNETMFNVSTPSIARQFGLGSASVSWMMTIFMVLFGIGSVVYGKLADLFSLRSLISVGVGLYAAGSVLGFLGQESYALVVAGRAVQGAGASAIPALVFVVVARFFPESSRGRIFGWITSIVSLGIGIGPVVGGLVSANLHWSWLFLIPLATLAALPFVWRILPPEPRKPGSLDVIGAVLAAAVVGSLMVALSQNQALWLLLTLVSAVLAAWRYAKARDPFIDPSLFANRRFANGVLVGFILFSMVMGIMFLVPLMLTRVHGIDPAQIGLILFPGAISSVFFGPLGGRLADSRGSPFVITLGLGLLVLSLVIMALFVSVSPWIMAGALLATYIGFSLFQTALVNSVSQVLSPEQTGVGMGMFNLISIVSGAIGTAVVGKILDLPGAAPNFLPGLISEPGAVYSNLMVIFALIIIAGGFWYRRSFGTKLSKEPARGGQESELPRNEPCTDCEW